MNREEYIRLRDRRLAESGLGLEEFCLLSKLAGWHVAIVEHELQNPEWLERLRVAAAEGKKQRAEARARRLSSAIYAALKGGPVAMANTSEAEVLTGLPPKLREFAETFDHEGGSGGCLITGPTGSQKSRGCVATTMRLVRVAFEQHEAKHYGSNFVTDIAWARAIDLANARRQHPLGSEPDTLEKAKDVRLLFLDDLGWEPVTDGTIAEVLAHRYDQGLVTVVTSGTPYPDLAKRYTEAPLRRILEAGGRKGQMISLFPPKPVSVLGGSR